MTRAVMILSLVWEAKKNNDLRRELPHVESPLTPEEMGKYYADRGGISRDDTRSSASYEKFKRDVKNNIERQLSFKFSPIPGEEKLPLTPSEHAAILKDWTYENLPKLYSSLPHSFASYLRTHFEDIEDILSALYRVSQRARVFGYSEDEKERYIMNHLQRVKQHIKAYPLEKILRLVRQENPQLVVSLSPSAKTQILEAYFRSIVHLPTSEHLELQIDAVLQRLTRRPQ